MLNNLFKTKSIKDLLAAADARQHNALKRTLGPVSITMLGIGAVIGAGIFATIGTAAAGDVARPGAGASLMLSFVITAIVCGFTAFCYAEFASMVPVSGSAYTYAYATMGELVAWIIAWELIIEYAIGNVAVAISWANYFRTFLDSVGLHLPQWLTIDYRTAAKVPGLFENAPHIFGVPIVFNLLAVLVTGLLTIVLIKGIKESSNFNAVMVIIKVLVLTFFICAGLYYVSPSEMVQNWQPFQPNGWHGTLAAAAVVFFAFIGFDAVSTVAEETRNPQRDMPIGIIACLAICTIFYVIVAAVFTGMIPYSELTRRLATETAEPLTLALQHVSSKTNWATTVVAFGSVVAHTAVLLVFQLGQARIFMAMSRDGLLPKTFSNVHPKHKTPHVATIFAGVFVAILAAFSAIDEMVDLTNIGTLSAFLLVCIGIPILRMKEPLRPRAFRVPFGPWLIPIVGAASCLFLIYYLPPASWWRFAGWSTLGLGVYFIYGYTHSVLGQSLGRSKKVTILLKIAASGFIASSVGFFVLPHNAGMTALLQNCFDAQAELHSRSLYGLILIIGGFCLGLGALFRESKTK